MLSNLDKISSPFSVKPDMSPELRLIEGKLLKERYSLIQQGISRRSIKIRNPCLYVNDKLYGQVKDSVFQLSPVTGQSSPSEHNHDSPMSDSGSPVPNSDLPQHDLSSA